MSELEFRWLVTSYRVLLKFMKQRASLSQGLCPFDQNNDITPTPHSQESCLHSAWQSWQNVQVVLGIVQTLSKHQSPLQENKPARLIVYHSYILMIVLFEILTLNLIDWALELRLGMEKLSQIPWSLNVHKDKWKSHSQHIFKQRVIFFLGGGVISENWSTEFEEVNFGLWESRSFFVCLL